MKRFHSIQALSAATAFGAVAMVAQTLLLRRFLWRFEAAETGVALFISCWLFWSGLGAAVALTPFGRKVTSVLSKVLWLAAPLCAALYFAQYALLENMRTWMGVSEYERFPLVQLALGCLLANAPFCLTAGFVIPSVSRRLAELGQAVSRAFAWEALGAACGGLCVTLCLVNGIAPDPRDEAEWTRYFPQAEEAPGRFETGGGTTFYGSHGGTFYALSSGGVSEVIPEGDRAVELAVLILSQRPYAKDVLLLGHVPLAAGLALESFRPDLSVVWCPCDAAYGQRLLDVVRAGGLQTRVRAAGETPQRFLDRQGEGTFDAVLVAPPQATTLEGASWRLGAFARRVRHVTRRSGVALFGLSCEAAALTPEKRALLEETVRGVRQVFPESGVFATGAGGWWIAARAPRLAYEAGDAAARFALLKREAFPAEAVALLYDAARAQSLMRACPFLNPEEAVLLPGDSTLEEVLAVGLSDAVRRAYPETAPGAWLERFKAGDAVRLAGLLLVVLGMASVAAGAQKRAGRRMLALWLAACGALGLAGSLAVLYRLQQSFGSLYLYAGVGSCLYLAGLFCGNRLAEGAARVLGGRASLLRFAVVAITLAEAGVALGAEFAAEQASTAAGLLCLCFAVGCAAGGAVPLALALCGDEAAEGAAAFVFADAVGAAVAGLVFVALVPMAGLAQAVGCFAVLAFGVALCAALSGEYARLTAGLALVIALAVLGGRLNEWRFGAAGAGGAVLRERPAVNAARDEAALPGVPRRLDAARVIEQMRRGELATNAAAFWE